MMSKLIALLSVLLLSPAFAADNSTPASATPAKPATHRFMVERTFPAGALDGLDAATKKKSQRKQCDGRRDLGEVVRECR